MEYARVRAVVVLVLVIASLGAASATIQGGSAGGGWFGAGDGDGLFLPGDGGDAFLPDSDDVSQGGERPLLTYLLSALVVVGFVVFLVGALRYWGLRDWLELFGALVAILVVFVAVVLGLRALVDLLGRGTSADLGGLGGGSGVGVGGTDPVTAVDLPAWTALVVLAASLAGAVLVARLARSRSAGASHAPSAAPPAPDAESDVAASAASRPSARSATDVDADNAVYRAWLALAETADADPVRDTPATVAEDAAAAGVDEALAREVTTLFEEVRYGPAAPTEERERRAARALERLDGAGQ